MILENVSYIKPETAKLAKSKGFNWEVTHYYISLPDGRTNNVPTRKSDSEKRDWNNPISKMSAPTQAVLQKWLREKHGLHVEIQSVWANREKEEIEYISLIPFRAGETGDEGTIIYHKTYEEALEEGLVEALNLINNEKQTSTVYDSETTQGEGV